MAEKYTYSDVIIDPKDPRVKCGLMYYFGTSPNAVIRSANTRHDKSMLADVFFVDDTSDPFVDSKGYSYSCLIKAEEIDQPKFLPFDLSKPEVRDKLRGKWIRQKDGHEETCITFFLHLDEGDCWEVEGYCSEDLLEYWVFMDGTPCGEEVKE